MSTRLDHDRKVLELVLQIKHDLARAAQATPATSRPPSVLEPGEAADGSEQMPRLRRQSRPLLRHGYSQEEPGSERRRQARADRVPEDISERHSKGH